MVFGINNVVARLDNEHTAIQDVQQRGLYHIKIIKKPFTIVV